MTRPARATVLRRRRRPRSPRAPSARRPSPRRPRSQPVVVESRALPPERTRTEEQAREEIERTPGGVAIVPQKADRGVARARTCKDVLDFVPGVLIRPRFGAADESQLSIRGSGLRNNFHLRGINVLIDGFPYGNADGFSDFESLELLTTKRIEVYKGANALRFGGNTLGGAINLVTKTGYDAGLFEMPQRGRLVRLLQELPRHRPGVRARSTSTSSFSDTELHGYRDHSRADAPPRLRHRSATGCPAAPRVRFDLGYVRNEEQLPGALTRQEFEHEPASSRTRRRRFAQGGAQLRLHARRPHRCARRSARTRRSSGRPSSTTRTSTTRCPSRSSTRRPTAGAPSCATSGPRRSSAAATASPSGFQYFGTRQTDAQFAERQRQPRRHDQEPGQPRQQPRASTPRSSSTSSPAVTLVAGGRAAVRVRAVRDRSWSTATSRTRRGLLRRSRPSSASSGASRRPCRSSATRATPTSRRCCSS